MFLCNFSVVPARIKLKPVQTGFYSAIGLYSSLRLISLNIVTDEKDINNYTLLLTVHKA